MNPVGISSCPFPSPDAQGLRLRPFATCEADLAVDFNATPRPFLVTQLLALCAAGNRAVPDDWLWNLSVGKRIEGLLRLAFGNSGQAFDLTGKCRAEGCGEGLEVEITLAEITEMQQTAEAVAEIRVVHGSQSLTFRRPTGCDQLAWLQTANQESPAGMMARSLWLGAPEDFAPTADWPEIVGDALAEHDPLVDFQVTAICPACGAGNSLAADLVEISLRRLQSAQRELLNATHRLAARYHWSESEIFAVPPWRRDYYLSLIERDDNR